jgi:hypothetical protein
LKTMAMITRLLVRVALSVLSVSAANSGSLAQYSMSLRFDTVTANPGDTVNVDVDYKFTSSKPTQSVQDFNLRFEYDTSEIYADTTGLYLVDYILDGTASASMSILGVSHHGILVANGSLDFSNPILCKIRFRVNKRLADTAFIRWDSAVSVFEYSDGITVAEQNGWIRTPSVTGRVILSTPALTVDTGKMVNIPVSITGIDKANIDSAVLRFEVDSSRLLFKGATAETASNAMVQAITVRQSLDTSHLDTVSIVLASKGKQVAGSDSLVTISIYSFPWYDTACVTLRDIRFVALNAGSVIGNTVSSCGSICIVPGSGKAVVSTLPLHLQTLEAYPNPARGRVTFSANGIANADQVRVEVFDAIGRRVFTSNLAYPEWEIPPDFRAGLYFATICAEARLLTTTIFIEP